MLLSAYIRIYLLLSMYHYVLLSLYLSICALLSIYLSRVDCWTGITAIVYFNFRIKNSLLVSKISIVSHGFYLGLNTLPRDADRKYTTISATKQTLRHIQILLLSRSVYISVELRYSLSDNKLSCLFIRLNNLNCESCQVVW